MVSRVVSRAALFGLCLLSSAGIALPASAEIIQSSESGFITRDEAVVEADLKQTWLALISPARWWSSAHTWSADAANLTLKPQAGGCFCEKIPEVDEPDRFTLEGSVEHMRVIQAYPEAALRMVGALGPLQSEPVTGVLTIAISKVDQGTRIVWEYNVGGSMRYKIPVISKAVDGVMSQQLAGLSKLLGKVDMPKAEPKPAQESAGESDGEAEAATSEQDEPSIAGEDMLEAGKTESEDESEKSPSVDEAFEDLSGS